MGLDMYLEKKTYVQNWDHNGPEGQHQITVQKGGKKHPAIKPERISEVTEQVAYWRKANAIHRWFVQHVQKGGGDCREYRVERSQLQELKDACDKVLAASKLKKGKINNGYTITAKGKKKFFVEDGEVIADPQIAETVLPTEKGFFFGSQDYDEYYFEDIKHTSKVIAELLTEPEDHNADFYYRASW